MTWIGSFNNIISSIRYIPSIVLKVLIVDKIENRRIHRITDQKRPVPFGVRVWTPTVVEDEGAGGRWGVTLKYREITCLSSRGEKRSEDNI